MLVAWRGRGANSLAAAERDLTRFAGFAAERGESRLAADAATLSAYMAHLAGQGFAASTQARRLSALRQFYRFLFAEGHRPDNPTLTIDTQRRRRPLPQTLSEDDVEALTTRAAHTAENGRASCRARVCK